MSKKKNPFLKGVCGEDGVGVVVGGSRRSDDVEDGGNQNTMEQSPETFSFAFT